MDPQFGMRTGSNSVEVMNYCRSSFLFRGVGFESCCAYFITVIGGTAPRNNFLRCLFIFISHIHIFTAHAGTTPQRYKTTQVNHLQSRKRLREQVTRQQQDIKILTRKPWNNGSLSPPPPPPYICTKHLKIKPVFNRQHKTYLNHGRGRYRKIFYGNYGQCYVLI
jgi:hypothetical protein